MLLIPHTLVGIAVGIAVKNPYVAVPLSFGLHFLGDLVPHWDYCYKSHDGTVDKSYPLKVMADMSVGIGLGMFFTLYALWQLKNPAMAQNIFLCGIASVLPDAIMGPVMFDENTRGLPRLIYKIQDKLHFQAPLPWGLISQIVVALSCLFLIVNSLGLL